VKIKKRPKGGIQIGKTVRLESLADETIVSVARELGLNNADILIRSDIGVDDLIDVIHGNKIYIPGLTVVNKIDLVDDGRLDEIKKEVHADVCISAEQKMNIDKLKDAIFERLDFIRVYCKEVGKKADLEIPLIMRRGNTIRDMCNKLHRDFVNKFRFAKIWGRSAKFPGQMQMLDHVLADGDVVQIHLK
jgi:ribosome-interacting GTPase 1